MTQSEVQRLFSYDADTGELRWKVRPPRSKIVIGSVAGCAAGDRWHIVINQRIYQRSYLVWIYHHGALPPDEIDHDNRISNDDRINNLRAATRSQQNANRGVMGHNTSGYRGIYFDPRKGLWSARISIFGKRKRLGMYANAEEAAQIVNAAGKAAYGEFWNAGNHAP